MKKSTFIPALLLLATSSLKTSAQSWNIPGNGGTNDLIHFVGTTDNKTLNFRVNNQRSGRIDHIANNSFFGYRAGFSNTGGADNTCMGTNALVGNTNGRYNTALGSSALFSNNTTNNNTAVGYQSLYSNTASDNTAYGFQSLYSNNVGTNNTAAGTKALYNNSGGNYNTATGMEALYTNTTASYNTATGYRTLFLNTGDNNTALGSLVLYNNTGDGNTGTGVEALYSNTSGYENTAVGVVSLFENTSGHDNSALGAFALEKNSNGSFNTASGNKSLNRNLTGLHGTATGYASLYNNQSGNENTADGAYALFSNISGVRNSALGYKALYLNTGNENTSVGNEALRDNSSGSYNTAVGYQALALNGVGTTNSAMGYKSLVNNTNGYNNTADGYMALSVNTTGFGNTALGANANVSASNLNNATAIGAGAIVNANNKMWLGNATINTIESVMGIIQSSDGRFKNNISENDVKGLEFIKKLRPVVYNFDTRKLTEFLCKNMPDSVKKKYLALDFSVSTAIRQSGFIAQEVEKAAEEVGYNFNGVHKPNDDNDNYGISYSQFVVPLVKAVQEQQTMIETQNASNLEMKNRIEELNSKIALLENKPASSNEITGTTITEGFYKGIILEQNIPNPFGENTSINYFIPASIQGDASIIIYDLQGKQLKRIPHLVKGTRNNVEISAAELYKGIFIYALLVNSKEIVSKRMVVE